MKTFNNADKSWASKSSAVRWAKKEYNGKAPDYGTVEKNEEGKWYFLPTPVIPETTKDEPIAAKKDKAPIVHKSTIGSPCRVVWDIAEEMEGEKRKDVIAECVRKGIAFYTARTQYQKYREAVKAAMVEATNKDAPLKMVS